MRRFALECEHKDKQNSICQLQHTWWPKHWLFSSKSSADPDVSRGWLLTPKERCNFREFTRSESSLCVLIWDHISAACVSVWASVSGRQPKWCRRCHYTMFDSVSALPTGSYESARVLDILCLLCGACVPHCVGEVLPCSACVHQITCQYHFTVADMRCVFKTVSQLLSIIRAKATICQLNYQGTKNIQR